MALPVIKLNELPILTDSSKSATLTIVSVADDNSSYRVPLNQVANSLFVFTNAPTSPTSTGTNNSMAVSVEAFYTYKGEGWGKTPRYTANWGDITPDTRFLLTNDVMVLSDFEIGNVLASLNLTAASKTTRGLVRGSDVVTIDVNGIMDVRTATGSLSGIVKTTGESSIVACKEYVDTKVAATIPDSLPIATTTTLGVITASDTVTVDSTTGTATVNIASPGIDKVGLLRLAPTTGATVTHDTWAAPVALVKELSNSAASSTFVPATSSTAGTVIPTGSIELKNATGAIDVKKASTSVYGVSKHVTAITEANKTSTELIPTVSAIVGYIGSQGTISITPEMLPTATTLSAGAIKASTSVKMSVDGKAYVPVATGTDHGIVLIETVANDPAPSLTYSKKSIDTKFSKLTWLGGDVENKSNFKKGLQTPAVTIPSSIDVINYGQVKTLIDNTALTPDKLPIATATTLGVVKGSSSVSIAADGTLTVEGGGGSSYVLPEATKTVLGGVKVDVTNTSPIYKSTTTGALDIRVAGELSATNTYPGIVFVSTPTGDRKPAAGDPDYYFTYSVKSIDYKFTDTLAAVDTKISTAISASKDATETIAGVKTFSGGLKTPTRQNPKVTDVINFSQISSLIANASGTTVDSVIPPDGNTYAIQYLDGIYRPVRIGEVPIVEKTLSDDINAISPFLPPGTYKLYVSDYGNVPTTGTYITYVGEAAGTVLGTRDSRYTVTTVAVYELVLDKGVIKCYSAFSRMSSGYIYVTVNSDITGTDLVTNMIGQGSAIPQVVKIYEV